MSLFLFCSNFPFYFLIVQSIKKRHPELTVVVIAEYMPNLRDSHALKKEVNTIHNILNDLDVPYFVYNAYSIDNGEYLTSLLKQAKVIIQGPAQTLKVIKPIEEQIGQKIVEIDEYDRQSDQGIYLENHEPAPDWNKEPVLRGFLEEKLGHLSLSYNLPLFFFIRI